MDILWFRNVRSSIETEAPAFLFCHWPILRAVDSTFIGWNTDDSHAFLGICWRGAVSRRSRACNEPRCSPPADDRQLSLRCGRLRASALRLELKMLLAITFSALVLAAAIAVADIWVRARGEIDRIRTRYSRRQSSSGQ